MIKNGTYVVFIDLDKTLLTVNSGKILVLESHNRGILSTLNLVKAIVLSVVYKLRLKNSIKVTKLMVKWLKGVSETTVETISKELVQQKLANSIRNSLIHEIKYHKANGAHIVLLSAALPYICEPLAIFLGIDGVICSKMEVSQGVFTGKPLGEICMGKEKDVQIRKYCIANSYSLKDSYSYGDSYTDRFALQVSGNPICVSPDRRLRKLAKIKKWKILK